MACCLRLFSMHRICNCSVGKSQFATLVPYEALAHKAIHPLCGTGAIHGDVCVSARPHGCDRPNAEQQVITRDTTISQRRTATSVYSSGIPAVSAEFVRCAGAVHSSNKFNCRTCSSKKPAKATNSLCRCIGSAWSHISGTSFKAIRLLFQPLWLCSRPCKRYAVIKDHLHRPYRRTLRAADIRATVMHASLLGSSGTAAARHCEFSACTGNPVLSAASRLYLISVLYHTCVQLQVI